jgi:glycosyltransferase involved in cell wall biosynthesis
MLVGGGDDFTYLQTQAESLQIAPDVRFVGRVTSGEVPAYYALAEVSLDPVYDDAAARGRSPLKLFESWGLRGSFRFL